MTILDLINVDQIKLSDKFQHSDDGFMYFIGYKKGQIVKQLYIISPQMTGYIKYFENSDKTCLSWLKMMMCCINTKKFRTRSKKS